MTDTKLTPFLFEGEGLVRVVMRDESPWFVAADVCRVLGIKNSRDAVERLDEDEKGVASTDTLGGPQALIVVSEGGLYTLVLRCRDATKAGTVAHRFRKWVTADVLPAIRRTGAYAGQKPRAATVENARVRELKALTAATNAATRSLGEIRRSAGARTAALAAPTIFAKLGVLIDLSVSSTLAQHEMDLSADRPN